ncbi:MAG: SigE family RNA polymerase sigma factor [Mycobacteriales bacterium]
MDRAKQFDTFVATRSGALLRLARILRPGDAEDLLQSALLKTWTRWGQLGDPTLDEATAYTRTVICRLAARWQRRFWRNELPSSDALPERSSEPGDTTLTALTLLAALQRLPSQWRVIVVLRFAEDLSVREVAETLGCSTGTVKSSTARALERLRQAPELHGSLTEGVGP